MDDSNKNTTSSCPWIRGQELNIHPSVDEPPLGSSYPELTDYFPSVLSRKSAKQLSQNTEIDLKIRRKEKKAEKNRSSSLESQLHVNTEHLKKSTPTKRQVKSRAKKNSVKRKNQRDYKSAFQQGAYEQNPVDYPNYSDVVTSVTTDITVNAFTNRQRVCNLIDECASGSGKKKLILSNLGLTQNDIPMDHLHLSSLKTDMHKLSLSGNQLFTIPSDLVILLTGLNTLDLSQCNLMELPDKWDLPQLRILNLRHNELNTFPEEAMFKGIPKLEHLDMYGNELCDIMIPDDTCNLKHLKVLDVGYNHISQIPDELGQLTSLRELNVMNNVIDIIPMKICNMSLKILNVSSNPLIQPPMETCERGIGSMKRFYQCLSSENEQGITRQKSDTRKGRRRKKKSLDERTIGSLQPTCSASLHASLSDSFQEDIVTTSPTVTPDRSNITGSNNDVNGVVNDTLKVIVVGMSNVGKTTIICRLTGAKIPTKDERTVGVHIHKWKPAENDSTLIDSETNDDSNSTVLKKSHIKFSVWDFAGQHVYHASHQIFYCKRALYILVWDMGAKCEHISVVENKINDDSSYEFALSSDDEDNEENHHKAALALERDIDEKVQFWVDCIENRVLGAAILIVASHNDLLEEIEAKRRCEIMKRQILRNEERRIEGLKERLDELEDNKYADTYAACRIRHQLSERPKLLFGDEERNVVRVNGKDNKGVDHLAEKIIKIAIKSPTFQGHVGARIPRMRLSVRDVVQEMRREFKVIAGGQFMDELIKRNIIVGAADANDYQNLQDTLYFLANIGEISYFGDLCYEGRSNNSLDDTFDVRSGDINFQQSKQHDFDTELELDSEKIRSQYIFLNPTWLMSAISCILRHDLSAQLEKCKRSDELSRSGISAASTHQFQNLSTCKRSLSRSEISAFSTQQFPVISANAANLLWREGRKTMNAEGRLRFGGENSPKVPLFDFLQELLIQFRVFVPINLNIVIEFGGERLKLEHHISDPLEDSTNQRFFFLPCLLVEDKPSDDCWHYKTEETWKGNLCHSILFHDSVPPGLMERITASILSEIYETDNTNSDPFTSGHLRINQIQCWQKTLILSTKLTTVREPNESNGFDGKENCSYVEIFVHLAEKDDKLCVASKLMGTGKRRLIICGQGPPSRVWNGGYGIVKKAVEYTLQSYRGLDFEQQEICPTCLRKVRIGECGFLDANLLSKFIQEGCNVIRCSEGHTIENRDLDLITNIKVSSQTQTHDNDSELDIRDDYHKIVLVGLWDGEKEINKITNVGTGFIVDKKKGLIMTAAHILIEIDDKEQFGKNYFGKKKGKVVIGIIPENGIDSTQAVFRYFAKIVAKDTRMEGKEKCCQIDACVLQITTRIARDIGGNGDRCANETNHVIYYSNNKINENLKELKIVDCDCERNEQVLFIGFNQGGGGQPINRKLDITKGNVTASKLESNGAMTPHKYRPMAEMTVNSHLICGHSGSPCINYEGKVVGMVSRTDPSDKMRCHLVPWQEMRKLLMSLKRARKKGSRRSATS